MGRAMLSNYLIQFSVDGPGCVSSLLPDLRPNSGGGNEENGELHRKSPCMHCYTQCPRHCSRPPPTHTFAGDTWTLPGKPGSVSLGVTAPISWVQVHTSFCLCPQRVRFPSPVYILAALLWVSGDLLQGGLCHAQGCCTQSPWPCGRPLLTCTFPGDTQTQSCLSLCGGVCALVCTRFV